MSSEPIPRDPGLSAVSPSAWIADHQTRLGRYLRFLGCPPDEVEDIVQDTFLVALERSIQDLAPMAARQWLRSTARNLFLATKRRSNREIRALEQLDAEWRETEEDREAYVDAVRCCVASLPPREREALRMRYSDGASRAEMSGALGISPAGVKMLLRRVRQRLRECVNRRLANGRTP